MNSCAIAEPRILIVEDDPGQSEPMRHILTSIPEEILNSKGISLIRVDIAASVNGAIKSLDENQTNAYDLCLVDLSLPQRDGEKFDDKRGGYTVIEHVMKTGAAKRVIVISVFDEYKYVVEAFRQGAFDFIVKRYEGNTLQAQVLSCLEKLLLAESNHLLNERIKDLIPYAEKGLAQRFRSIFTRLVNSIGEAVGKMEEDARKRYGLDPVRYPHDAMMRQLRAQKEAVSKAQQSWSEQQALLQEAVERAQQEWGKQQALLQGEAEQPREEIVEEVFAEIKKQLRPCLAAKRTELFLDVPRGQRTPILTFQRDVQAVLRELILGGVSELPDWGEPKKITVSVERKADQVSVRIEDDLESIPAAEREKVNEGYSIVPEPSLGRVWGLSIAQHIALRGVGELTVERKKPYGNIIIYRTQLATHA